MMAKAFSKEYTQRLNSRKWRQYGKVQRSLWCGRDALIPLLPAHDIEHLTYKNFGKEWFIRDTIPLNRVHHRRVVTPLRTLTKGGGRKITTTQRVMTRCIRLWAIAMLPVIWIVWGVLLPMLRIFWNLL